MPILLFSCTAALSHASAQGSLELSQSGGGIGQNMTFRLDGDKNRPYPLWFDEQEVDTTFPSGIVPSVGFDPLHPSLQIPGFLDATDASGEASVTVGLPNDPALADLRLSRRRSSSTAWTPFRT